jgi:hypothetical protein
LNGVGNLRADFGQDLGSNARYFRENRVADTRSSSGISYSLRQDIDPFRRTKSSTMRLGVRDDFRNWLQLGLPARERA